MYKILIIDDETLIRKSISKLIETNLPECEPPEEARSAAEGIEKVNLLTPDIIITDICMNDMTGEKAEHLRKGYCDYRLPQL